VLNGFCHIRFCPGGTGVSPVSASEALLRVAPAVSPVSASEVTWPALSVSAETRRDAGATRREKPLTPPPPKYASMTRRFSLISAGVPAAMVFPKSNTKNPLRRPHHHPHLVLDE